MIEPIQQMLTGGHANSLGRTVEVVELVLAGRRELAELMECYGSADEVVRLRTSNALKRISRERPEWLVPYLDRLLGPVAAIDQASTQWTLADLFGTLEPFMSPRQKNAALSHMKINLVKHHDWIVLNQTMKTLTAWAAEDDLLTAWLRPVLRRHGSDQRKSVARTAIRMLAEIETKQPGTPRGEPGMSRREEESAP